MKFISIALMVLLSLSLPKDASASPKMTCVPGTPPKSSGVTETDGQFFFVFPRGIVASFSGCQTMWNEKGEIIFMLKFQKGLLVQYSRDFSISRAPSLVCKYRNKNLWQSTQSDCPEYSSIENGFQTIDKPHEPVIPQARDPRK